MFLQPPMILALVPAPVVVEAVDEAVEEVVEEVGEEVGVLLANTQILKLHLLLLRGMSFW